MSYGSDKVNPHYNPEHFGLDQMIFDQSGMSYEYNTLCFWATNDGRVFTASDSGCSCPTPFEGYECKTVEELLPQLERVESPDQAVAIFDGFNNGIYDKHDRLSNSEKEELRNWVESKMRKNDNE